MWDDEKKPDLRENRVSIGNRLRYPEFNGKGDRPRSKIPPLLINRLYDLIII
jgi:hypothetical protein